MNLYRIEDMKGGWFVGDFTPAAFQTKACEVSYKVHQQGERWDDHYHRYVTEVNLLVRGTMVLQDRELTAGDIFVLSPYEIADPVFLETCEIVCVKLPSFPNDKVVFQKVAL